GGPWGLSLRRVECLGGSGGGGGVRNGCGSSGGSGLLGVELLGGLGVELRCGLGVDLLGGIGLLRLGLLGGGLRWRRLLDRGLRRWSLLRGGLPGGRSPCLLGRRLLGSRLL